MFRSQAAKVKKEKTKKAEAAAGDGGEKKG
jgi:hypothetical protein